MINEVAVRNRRLGRAGIRAKAKSLKAREARQIDFDGGSIIPQRCCSTIG